MGCFDVDVLRAYQQLGLGGSSDENGETTLDALVMNGVLQTFFLHVSLLALRMKICCMLC